MSSISLIFLAARRPTCAQVHEATHTHTHTHMPASLMIYTVRIAACTDDLEIEQLHTHTHYVRDAAAEGGRIDETNERRSRDLCVCSQFERQRDTADCRLPSICLSICVRKQRTIHI
ncbi:unnamed protein product [Trichogramma brassicae]|uniref:Uncharacterized protein n=1 Tax=Trichogramma brassicae TaxID=86971 RepID=A0A6H5J3I1_9HYME|nr:unnamed protein product [Trichogramma brassicae]